jgi:hypothetical protein
MIDDVKRPLGDAVIDLILTTGDWADRILGVSRMYEGRHRIVWLATGNRLRYTSDTSERVVPIRLHSTLEQPRLRTDQREKDLRGFAFARRKELLVAALTIVRAWIVAGRPNAAAPWGSFDEWAETVAACVVWSGMPDPQLTRAEARLEDDTQQAHEDLLRGLVDLAPRGITTHNLIAALFPRATDDGRDALRLALHELTGSEQRRPLAALARRLRAYNKIQPEA